MGIFGNIKDLNEKQQQRAQAMRDKLPVRLKAQYYGGYDKYTNKSDGVLFIHVDNVQFIGRKARFTIDKADIKELAVEGQDQVLQQRTITRNILLAGKSKNQNIKDTYITITTTTGQEAVFHIEGKSHMELKPVIVQKIALPASANTNTQAQLTGSVADELTKLAALKQQGIITQEEFDKKKTQLLG